MTSSSSSSPEISAATASDSQARFSYKHATHDEVLEDLSSRFILNLPDEELASLERICFQVEQAHWFYEDFIREENPKFPSLPLKKFSAMLFHACPLLHQWSHDHEQAFNTFMQYKTRVPVCGAIMLNDTWEKCVLVKGWKSSSGWGFPKGKINEDEPAPNCAVREVLEETGYNLAGQIDPKNVIEMSIKEQKISLYIVPGVPEDYPFKTKTRKEISKIEWFRLTDLPTWRRNKTVGGKFYLISPFIGALKTFINERKPRGATRKGAKTQRLLAPPSPIPQPESCHNYTDSAQESSSQSSSADMGDPQTPSPQYPQSIINTETHVIGHGMPSESIDPHFARLLSALTMSASEKHPVENDHPITSVEVLPISKDPSTPVPNITSLTQQDWSSSAPHRLMDSGSDLTVTPAHTILNPRIPSSPSPSMSATPPVISNSPIPTNWSMPKTHIDIVSSPLPTNIPISPSRSLSSRRTSGTADVLPYLSRPTELPASAKKLRQLALLESVADESARLTPILAQRQLTPVIPHETHNYLRSPSSISSQPATIPRGSNDLRVIYSSGRSTASAGIFSASPLLNHTGLPHQYDPFQVRSRTSHALHHGPTYLHPRNNSLNQNQLMGVVGGTAGQVRPYPPTPAHMSPPHHPNGIIYSVNQLNSYGTLPGATLEFGSRSHQPNPSGSLLSILNAKVPLATPSLPPTSGRI
ncbi:Dcp2, box A domain-containing protein [Infundibulicybe gibba]|nr:Dcp2, box A domain-containing protein [Infundibulicybe gibba]